MNYYYITTNSHRYVSQHIQRIPTVYKEKYVCLCMCMRVYACVCHRRCACVCMFTRVYAIEDVCFYACLCKQGKIYDFFFLKKKKIWDYENISTHT